MRIPAAQPLMVAGAAVLLAAGCGGGHPSGSSHAASAVAFAGCMRSNGVAKYPDPCSNGTLLKESPAQLGVSSARFQSAQGACRHLLPNGGAAPTPAQVQHASALSLRFAQCVRAHGVPGFPDPDSTGRIPDPASVGIDQGSPKFEAANQACASYRPPYMPSNSAFNAWARTHGQG